MTTANSQAHTINTWAAAYQAKQKHPPLVVGREYTYGEETFADYGEFVRLIEASETMPNVTVETRFGRRFDCDKQDLQWKPERHA